MKQYLLHSLNYSRIVLRYKADMYVTFAYPYNPGVLCFLIHNGHSFLRQNPR